MIILDELKSVFRIMFKPSSLSSKRSNFLKTTIYYYKATLIPVIVLTVLTFFLNNAITQSTNILVEVLAWILLPALTLLETVIIHALGKSFLSAFKQRLSDTYYSATLSAIFIMALIWTSVIYPLIFIPILVILAIWAFVILVISISTVQEISRTESLVIVVFGYAILYTIINMAAIAIVSQGIAASSSVP